MQIISCFPEVLDETVCEAEVVPVLQSLISSHPELTVVILDTLTSFKSVQLIASRTITSSLQVVTLNSVQAQVLQELGSFEADSLPVVVRFLLQAGSSLLSKCCYILLSAVSADKVDVVIVAIRKNLSFESISKSSAKVCV